MSDFSTYIRQAVLNWLDGTAAFPASPAGLYIGLHDGDPGATGAANEVTTSIVGAATRTTIGALTATAADGDAQKRDNNAVVNYVAAAANVSDITVTHLTIWDNATVGSGNCIYQGALTTSKTVSNGDPVQFNANSIALKTS